MTNTKITALTQAKISTMLQTASQTLPRRYAARPGETVRVALPQVPLSRYTEYVRFALTTKGDSHIAPPSAERARGEGSLLPPLWEMQALAPGTVHLWVQAQDRLTGETLAGVAPIEIVVDVRPPRAKSAARTVRPTRPRTERGSRVIAARPRKTVRISPVPKGSSGGRGFPKRGSGKSYGG